MPSLAGTDGRKFSTSTSAVSTMRWRTASPSGCFRSSASARLPRFGADKKPAFAGQARRKLPQHVALRGFDLDHGSAEIGEQRAAVRAGEIAAQIEDSDAAKRARCCSSHRCSSLARMAAIFSKTRCAR